MKDSAKLAIEMNVVTTAMIAGACGISAAYAYVILKRLGCRPIASIRTGKAGRPAPVFKSGTTEMVKSYLR